MTFFVLAVAAAFVLYDWRAAALVGLGLLAVRALVLDEARPAELVEAGRGLLRLVKGGRHG